MVVLLRGTANIAAAARKHDESQCAQSWLSWLQEGPAKGLGAQHYISRVATGWIPSPVQQVRDEDGDGIDFDEVDDVSGVSEAGVVGAGISETIPLDHQQAVDSEAAKWAEIWRAGQLGARQGSFTEGSLYKGS